MVTLNQVIGTWKVTEDPFNSGEDTVYKFFSSGDLTLSFESRKRKQYIFLRFNLEGDTIITDQPSAPKIERARIAVDGNEMTLDYGGKVTRLKKLGVFGSWLYSTKHPDARRPRTF